MGRNGQSWLAVLGLASMAAAIPSPSGLTPYITAEVPNIDDVPLPPSVPRKIKITDTPNDPAGKLVKVRIGPFTLPPNSVFAALPEQAGGAKVNKPCEECWLGAFQGGLEYEDGSDANVDTGMYLHHFVTVNVAKPDWYCGLKMGGFAMPQFIYNSGNERPPVRLNNKYKFGMRVDKGDHFAAAAELMNMSNETKTVYATTIYEVIPFGTPDYREATHLRIDVWQCGGSDVPARKGKYQYTSPVYTSPYSGVILHNDGHGHDGTTYVDLERNNQTLCRSQQYYGLRKGWTSSKEAAMSHAHESNGVAMQYISDAVACEDEGRIEKGDRLRTIAHYDDTKYPQMQFKGHLENQMGISFLYIGRDKATLNDKLKITKPTRLGLPDELQGASSPYKSLMKPKAANTSATPIQDQLKAWGLPAGTDLNKLFPGAIPKDSESDETFVTAPPSPPQMPAFDLQAVLPSWIPSYMTKGLTMDKLTQNRTVQNMLTSLIKRFIKGVPEDFDISKILVPGGIIVSEVEPLRNSIMAAYGIKDPMASMESGAHDHHARVAVNGMYVKGSLGSEL